MESKYSGEELPNQLISTAAKNKSWREANAKYLTERIFTNDTNSKRKSYADMTRYYNTLLGIADYIDLQETFDPLGVNRDNTDALPENTIAYNPLKKGFRVLFNEARKRKIDVKAVAVNAEVINEKDREFREKATAYFQQFEQRLAQGENVPDEEIKRTLDELTYYKQHDLQSAHEVMANQLINYFRKTPSKRIADTLNKGFQDITVIGEEIYRVGAEGDEPVLRKVNNKRFLVIGMGNSDYIEDGWAWVEWDYLPKHKIIEEFGGKLTRAEIKSIEESSDAFFHGGNVYQLVDADMSVDALKRASNGNEFDARIHGSANQFIGGKYIDSQGNVLVARFQWISQRKLYEITLEDGSKELVDENYKVREDLGQTAEELWVNELWEGIRIGEDIYKDIRPAISQMRSINNPAAVRPYYVGTLLTYGDDNIASSVMDELIPLKRDFDLTANRLRKIWARHLGNIMRISKSRIPKDMSFEEWYRWLSVFNISIEDDFNMSPESGAFAGNMQAQTPIIPLSVANEVDACIRHLSYVQSRIDDILSIPPARSGDLKGNEGLGVTQQSVIGATLSTEDLYDTHENTVLRVFEVLIEFTKQLWDEQNVVKQYLLDDMSQFIFNYDGKRMQEAEFSVVMTNSGALKAIEQDVLALGQAFAQNGTISFTDMLALRTASSASEVIKRIQASEEKMAKRRQEEQDRQAQAAKELEEMRIQSLERKHQMDLEKIRLQAEYDIQREQVRMSMQQSANSQDENGDGIEDDIELRTAKLDSDTKKEINAANLRFSQKQHEDDVRLKELELKIKQMSLSSPNKPKK